MPWTDEQMQDLITQAQNVVDENRRLELDLRIAGKYDEASKLSARTKVLDGYVNMLIMHRMDSWQSSYEQAKPNIQACTQAFKDAADKIKQAVEANEKFIAALKTLDDLIGILTSLMPVLA
jgi:hypothetical protein